MRAKEILLLIFWFVLRVRRVSCRNRSVILYKNFITVKDSRFFLSSDKKI